jgi:hypothetical protein
MVDKVFADWQGNPDNEFPHLDTKRKIAPFGSKQFNKFTLTNIPPAKTLDFESNLCYCYDCDLEQDFNKVKLPERTGKFLSRGQPIFAPLDDDYDKTNELLGRNRSKKYDSLTVWNDVVLIYTSLAYRDANSPAIFIPRGFRELRIGIFSFLGAWGI